MKRFFRLSLPAAALVALAIIASAAFVGCSEDKGTNGGSSSSSSSSDDFSSSGEPEYGTPEFWEKDWQETLATFGCPQPTDTIEGWKLAGLKTGVVPDNTDSNLVMQIREHDSTLIIRTYRGDLWTAHFPELEWTHVYLPSRADVAFLGSQGDSVFASTVNGELWTAKFKNLSWRKISPEVSNLRKYPAPTTQIFGDAVRQRGDTLFWAIAEISAPASNIDGINEEPIYASINGEWRKTEVADDTGKVLRDGVWKFNETRGVLRALTYSDGIWEWDGSAWRKADLLGRGETTPLAPGEVRGMKHYRDIAEHDGRVWIAELKGHIESSPDMTNWTNHWEYHLWQGDNETAIGVTHALHPYKERMLISSTGGVLQWVEETNLWIPIDVADCFERRTTRAPHVGYGGWGPPGYVHEFVVIGDTIVAGVADYNYGLSGVYMFDLKEATWK